MACMQAFHLSANTDQKTEILMILLVHVMLMDIKVVVEESRGSGMVLHHMEEEADHMGGALVLLERSSLILMENMFTGMIQICRQEKAIGYARIPTVEILILLGELTVTTATSIAIHEKYVSLATVLTEITSILHVDLQGILVQVIGPLQERWPGTGHHPVVGEVTLRVIQLDHLQIMQDGMQIQCKGKEWASVVIVS